MIDDVPPPPDMTTTHYASPCQHTTGDWPNEAQAAAELDERLARITDLFTSFREVSGEYVQPRYMAEEKTPRIDRLLIPTRKLVEGYGWSYGVAGIECKCSGKKLGTIIAQCQDYGRALFKSPKTGVTVACEWIFIWPLSQFAGDIASVMTQNRIGGASGGGWTTFQLKTACGNLLRIDKNGNVEVGKVNAGKRTGSR